MEPRKSTARKVSAGLLALVVALAWSAGAAADCAQLAAHYLNAFSNAPMESMDADDTISNPCTGKSELAVIEFRPGYGSVAMFASGDVYGEVDPFVAILCEDGRAMLQNAVQSTLVCDTR